MRKLRRFDGTVGYKLFMVPIACFAGEAGAAGVSGNAQGAAQAATGESTGETASTTGETVATTTQQDATKDKTFTQADITRIAAAEKEQGRRSVLAELGITDPAQAKSMLELAAKISDATKPPDQKLTEADSKVAEAEARAKAAEAKLILVQQRVKTDSLDDVFTLASARVTKDVDFDAAVQAIKKQYPLLFDDVQTGTGTPASPAKADTAKRGEYGKRAANVNKQPEVKSSFFTMTK